MFCTVEGNRVAALPTFLSQATQGPKLTETDVVNTRLLKSSWHHLHFSQSEGKITRRRAWSGVSPIPIPLCTFRRQKVTYLHPTTRVTGKCVPTVCIGLDFGEQLAVAAMQIKGNILLFLVIAEIVNSEHEIEK